MRVLLTGATGLLGNNILRTLLSEGHSVAAIIRGNPATPALDGLAFHPISVELTSPRLRAALPEDVDVVVHCAAQIQIGRTKLAESRAVNVEATRVLAQFCRQSGLRLVHISTVDTLAYSTTGIPLVEGETEPAKPPATYVVTKREAEAVVREEMLQGLEAVIIHPGFMLGPYDWRPSSAEMMVAVAKLKPPLAPGGGCSVAHVQQVAAAIVTACAAPVAGQSFIMAGHNVTYFELWKKMAQVIGCRGPLGRLPNWLAHIVGRVGDLTARVTGRETNINSLATNLGQLMHFYSSERSIAHLNYEIPPLEEILEDTWGWIRQQNWLR